MSQSDFVLQNFISLQQPLAAGQALSAVAGGTTLPEHTCPVPCIGRSMVALPNSIILMQLIKAMKNMKRSKMEAEGHTAKQTTGSCPASFFPAYLPSISYTPSPLLVKTGTLLPVSMQLRIS